MYLVENEILRKQFNYGNQGFSVVKCLVYIYCLKEIGKSIRPYDSYIAKSNLENLPEVYMLEVHDLVKSNLNIIDKKINPKLSSLLKDCIVSFYPKFMPNTGMSSALSRISSMTQDEIVQYIVNEANTIDLGKEDCSTPDSVVNLVFKLLHKKDNEKWYDLGCCSGDFLLKLNSMCNGLELNGNDIKFDYMLLAKIRLYFAQANAYIFECDSIHSAQVIKNVDCAFSNFPWSYRVSDRCDYNVYNKYILPVNSKNNMDWVFIDRMLQSLNSNGRAIAVVPNGALSNTLDYQQRKNSVDMNLIEGIISLPSRLFNYSSISTSLIVFNMNKKDDYIKILDASNMYIDKRRINELKVEEIVKAYNEECRTICKDDIEKNDYSLNVSNYINLADIKFQNEVLIEDIMIDVFRGYQFTANQLDESATVEENNYRILSVGDLQDGSFIYDNLQKISIDEKRASKFQVLNGDILISARATTLKTSIAEISTEKIVASGSIIVVRCDQSKINPVYLKAFLDSKTGQKLLESVQSGTGIISLNANAIKKIRLPLLDREIQDEIARKYLNTLDMLRITRIKLGKLEKQIVSIFDETTGGEEVAKR